MNASLLILSDSPHQQGAVSHAVMVATIVDNLERRLPMKLQIASKGGGHYHHVVVDGFQLGTPPGEDGAHSSIAEAQQLLVHLNIGHSGYDNGWFDFDQPICLRHYQNGTRAIGGGCAFYYDNTTYRQLWTIEPVASSWDASTLEDASVDTRQAVSQQAAKPILGLEPPAFATEFALNYTVRNFQFGFVVRGTWSVDHQDSTGQFNLRERNDNANASLHPQTEVKDYRLHRLWQKDPAIPQGACVAPIAQDLTQARFVVPANASLLPASTVPGSSVWRVLHSAGSICVDFTVKPPPDGDFSKLLPSVIEYFGQCTSPTMRQPGEVLGELHNYTDFAFADLPESLFLLQPKHSKCPTTAVMHTSGGAGLGGHLTLGGRMAGTIDTVIFGDNASMAAHFVHSVNTSVVLDAALGEPALQVHRVGPGAQSDSAAHPPPPPEGTGWVRFQMKVVPNVTNYFTLKTWGGAPSSSQPSYETLTFLLHPEKLSSTMGMPEFMAAALGKNMGGRIPVYPNELDLVSNDQMDSNDGPFPGRWQYMTYVLPATMVPASGRATLAIGSGAREVYGPFQLYPSRAYFRAYTHLDALLDITGETQGTVVTPPPRSSNSTSMRSHLLEQTRLALLALDQPAGPECEQQHRGCGSQFVGPVAAELVKAGAADPHFIGAMTSKCGISLSANRSALNVTDVKSRYSYCVSRKSGLTAALHVWARGYHSNASWAANYSGSTAVLNRIALAFDFYRRAQGSNGGFSCSDTMSFANGTTSNQIPGLQNGGYYCNDHQVTGVSSSADWWQASFDFWIGGPTRRNSSAWQIINLAPAFIEVADALQAHGLLDMLVDDDFNDQTPKVSRREALSDLFAGARDFMASSPGHPRGGFQAPNSWLSDMSLLYASDRALHYHLDASRAYSPARIATLVGSALGLTPMPWPDAWPAADDTFVEVSPSGISMELLGSYAGGYSAGYGDIWTTVGELLMLARGDEATTATVGRRLTQIIGSFARFRLWDQGYGCLRPEATLSARKNSNSWRCEYSFQRAGAVPAAVALQNPDALRQAALFVRDKKWLDFTSKEYTQFVGYLEGAIDLLELQTELEALIETHATHRLPQEPGAPDFGWADPVAHVAVAKAGGEQLFAALQWRHDMESWQPGAMGEKFTGPFIAPTPNSIARVRLLQGNQTTDRIMNVKMDTQGGFYGVYSLQIGSWCVGMNANRTSVAVWHVPMRCVGGAVDELITKKAISSVHAQWTLRAGQTAILRMKTDDSQVRGGLSEPPRASALPVQRHIGRWNSTPTVTPGSGNVIDGPLIGNGDAGAALTSLRVEQLDFYLGKGDYWADAVNYHWGFVYMHLAGGHLSVSTSSGSAASECIDSSDGNPTTASASWDMEGPASENGCTSSADCSPVGMLLTDTFFGAADGSFTVAAVPFPTYEIIVYFRMNEEHSFNISSQQCVTGRTPTTVMPLAAVNGSLVSATYPSPSNYLRLSGCKGGNLTVHFTSGGEQVNHRKSMAALQIVETGASSAFSSPRSIGINIVGKTARDKTGPIRIPREVEAGVVPQTNWVNLGAPGCGLKKNPFNASQHLFEARIDGSSGRLRSSSIMQANENTLISHLECAGCASPQRMELSLKLSDFWTLPSAAGVSATQLWTRHENNYADRNPMALGSCNPHALFVRGVAKFLRKASMLVVSNGTDDECPMLLPPGAQAGPWATAQKRLRLVARGPCTDPLSNWTLEDNRTVGSGSAGPYIKIRSAHSPELCLGTEASLKDQIVYALDCDSGAGALLLWLASDDPASGRPFSLELIDQTSRHSSGCLVSTAGNTNNTLAIVTEVREDGTAIALGAPTSDGKLAAQASFTMIAGRRYELVTALISRRDLAEPGQYRYPYSGMGSAALADVTVAASHAAREANTTALRLEHSVWWQDFWNRSSVDLGPKYQLVEGWWFGMQYLLGSASRSGEVVPSLFGPWVINDPPSWVDDITMDYNIEANFYGCGSSNHLELMEPYFATIYSLHADCAARAASPDWSVPGRAPKPSLGPNTYGFECGHHAKNGNSNDNGCPRSLGNFSGIALVNGIGPFAYQRLFHDDSDRFTAALAATPMKQYWEYSQDVVFLGECYEWIRDAAEFYASYVVCNEATGKREIPFSCGEEGCVLRNEGGCCPHAIQPDQAKNSMADLALARMILRMAAEYGAILGRDSDRWQHWLDVAEGLAPYPTVVDPLSGREVFAEATDADRNTSLAFGANLEEPMLYLTAVFPAEQIGRRRHGAPPSAEEERQWSIANNTLFGIAEYTRRWAGHGAWAPLNGLCQLWPPVARLIKRDSSAAVLHIFTETLARQMYPNFYPHLDGGGLEQAGAVGVINEMLLATDPRDGYLEFFPLWPLGEAAAFVSLRAKGAFVCSGSVDSRGEVGEITVLAESAGNMSFASPTSWGQAVPRVTSTSPIHVIHSSVGGGVYQVQVVAGGIYTLAHG